MSTKANPSLVKKSWSLTPTKVIATGDLPVGPPKSGPKISPRANDNDPMERKKQKIFYIELDTPGTRIDDQGPTGQGNGLSPVEGSEKIEDDEPEEPDTNIHWYYGDMIRRMTVMNKRGDKIKSGRVPDPNN
jgi:hypothetical protein